MPFKNKLKMEHIQRTELFRLIAPLIYETWEGEIRITPKDFITDGHSYPRFLNAVLGNPIASETVEASVIHDFGCQEDKIPRRQLDSEYSQAMADLGWDMEEERKSWIHNFKRTFRRKRNWLGVRIGAFGKWISNIFKKKEEVIEDVEND